LLSAVFVLLTTAVFGSEPNTTQAQNQIEAGENTAYLPIVTQPDCTTYVETNSMIIMEVEAVPPVDQWSVETFLPGYTGDSYYIWRGPNYFGNPGNAVLTYPILITTGGLYNLRIHNRHDFPDPTEENDVWVRMDDGPWIKAYSPINNQWTWQTWFDFGTSQTNATFTVNPGTHTFEMSARSFGFSIDRVALYLGVVDGQDVNLPVSPCV
jgi:hypothetical protein